MSMEAGVLQKKVRCILQILGIGYLCFGYPATVGSQELVTEDSPPMNMMQDGKIVGISTEKLVEAFRRSGRKPHLQIMPWSRAYQQTLDNPNYCAYSTARTPDRESLFKWVGPLATDSWILFTRVDNHNRVAKIEDIKNELIGAQRSGALSSWLLNRGYKIDPAPYDLLNPAKLLKGRFNYGIPFNNKPNKVMNVTIT